MKIKRKRKVKYNKKGDVTFMPGQVAGIVIAVIVLAVLALIVVPIIYGFFQDQGDLQKAESYVGVIKNSVDDAKNNAKHESFADIFGPTNWWVIAWPYKNQIEKPYSCKGYDSCICICSSGNGVSDSLNHCNSDGRCVGVDGNIKTIYKKSPPAWYQRAVKNTIDFMGGDTTNIPLPIDKPPIELKITYDKDKGYEVIAE